MLLYIQADADSAEGEEVVFAARPEIHHKFKVPEKRPFHIVALLFTAVAALPLVFLARSFKASGANFARLPRTASAYVNAVVFQGFVAAVLALFVVFWVGLNMFSTLFILAPIAGGAAFTGMRALSDLAN